MRTLDDKTILLDRAELAAMQTDPNVLRETILERAVATGKILAAQRDHYRERYNRDRAGTVRLLASLAPGVKPSDARSLREFERQQGDELLASARAAFPELRRRQANRALHPRGRPVLPAHVAGEGSGAAATSLSPAAPSHETIASLFPELRQRRSTGRITWADK
jgi:hypothetical protein